MSDVGKRLPKEYSDLFDEYRQNRCEVSFDKYGSAAINFGEGFTNALGSVDLCIDKYKKTGNTEYLCDAANYIMFEFMYPSRKDAYFRATGSGESAGRVGTSINQLETEYRS